MAISQKRKFGIPDSDLERFLKAVIKSSKDAIIAMDSEDRIIFWNPAAEKMFGYSSRKIIGKKLHKLIPMELDLAKYKTDIKEFNKTGKNWVVGGTFELPVKRRGGQIFYIELSVSSFKIRGKWNAIGILRETTEKRNYLENLKRDKMRYEMLTTIFKSDFASIQELLDFALEQAISLTSSKIGYIYFYDTSKKQFILNSWSKEVMKECTVTKKQTVYELNKTGIWGEAVRQKKPIIINDFEAPDPLKKGYPKGHVHLERFLTIPVFENNQIVAVVGVANKEADYTKDDIEQLDFLMASIWPTVKSKQSELENRKLASIVDSSSDAIFSKDSKGTILSWNNGAEKLYGYSKKEIIGQNVKILSLKDDQLEIEEMIAKVLEGESFVNLERKRVKKDGTVIEVSLTISPVYDQSKKIIAISVIAHDLSTRRKLEKALKEKEKRFKIIYDSSSDAIMTIEPPDWRFTYGNSATLKLFGLENEEQLQSLSPGDLSPKSQLDGSPSSEKAKEMIEKALKNGSHYFRWVHRKFKGPNFNANVLLTKINLDGKDILQATVRDMSSEIESENKLKEKIIEIEKLNKLMIGRELKMIELKKEIKSLKENKETVFAVEQDPFEAGIELEEVVIKALGDDYTNMIKSSAIPENKKMRIINDLSVLKSDSERHYRLLKDLEYE